MATYKINNSKPFRKLNELFDTLHLFRERKLIFHLNKVYPGIPT